MNIQLWFFLGVAVPYLLISAVLWGLFSRATHEAVAAGALQSPTPIAIGTWRVSIPTVWLRYALGILTVGFLYVYALTFRASTPEATAVLLVMAPLSWVCVGVLALGSRSFGAALRSFLDAPRQRDRMASRYQLLAQNMTDMVTHLSVDGRYKWVSPSSSAITGYSPADLVGSEIYDCMHTDDQDRVRREIEELLVTGEHQSIAIRYRFEHSDGSLIWLESTIEGVYRSEDLIGIQAVSRDVTEHQTMSEEIHRRVYHDPLTDLANRALFNLRLDSLIEEARAGERDSYAVIYIDLDNFRAVNDAYGHIAGDAVMFELARRLLNVAGENDTVARVDGDEFAILLDVVEGETMALKMARQFQEVISRAFSVEEYDIMISASVGVAMSHPSHNEAGDLLREGDLASKAAEIGQAHLFTAALKESSDRRLRIEGDLFEVVSREELRVVYQPLVCLKDKRLIGFEALVRWDHPELGLLHPDAFISLAEEMGVIGHVDRWVLNEGLRHIEMWEEEIGRPLDLAISINCSSYDIRQRGFANIIRELLEGHEGAADRVVLEITESLLVDNPFAVARELETLRQTGIRFALDDFGTGYSSLSTIHALPIDLIKIDKSFVQRMEEDESSGALVKTILQLGAALDATVLAEGIETREQFDRLRALGCDFGQGFLFARPLSPEDAWRLIQLDGAAWDGHWTSSHADAPHQTLFSNQVPTAKLLPLEGLMGLQ